MTTDELLELERLAKNATRGKWRTGYAFGQCFLNHEHGRQKCEYQLTGYGESADISIDAPLMSAYDCAATIVNCNETGDVPSTNDVAYIVAAQPSAVLALIERIRHLEQTLEAERKDVDRAREFIGYGGYAGDAPREILLAAERDMGCDAWLNLQRVYAAGEGNTNLDRMTHIRWTEPVLYVRADTR